MALTLYVAEDDALVRAFLNEVVSREADLELVGSAANGLEYLEAVARLRPRMLLLDLRLPGLSGLKVLERLSGLTEKPLVLVLSGEEDEEMQVEVARSGADGFLPKSQAAAVLPRAIRAVAAGELWFSRRVASRIFLEHRALVKQTREQNRPVNLLSDREREVLACVARGATNGQIAEELYMSIHTVKLHVQNILRKLRLPNRTEAAVYAVREGLLEDSGV